MRNKFDQQLETLNDKMNEMGALIEDAINGAVLALTKQNVKQAKGVIDFDKEIDQKEKEIEHLCLKLLLQQQPVAKDLRQISSALKMVTDMERIGDQAADISQLAIEMADVQYFSCFKNIVKMSEVTKEMVKLSVEAFINADLELAEKLLYYDDMVDELFNVVKTDMINVINKNIENGEQAVDLLMVAKYFERIGDHAENIAEWVVYSITGTH